MVYCKLSQTEKALIENGTYYCSIDDFCTANITSLKNILLNNTISAKLEQVSIGNLNDLLKEATTELRMDLSDVELQNYYNKYTNKIRLKIDKEGNIFVQLID